MSSSDQAILDAVSDIIKHGSVAPDHRLVITAYAWDALASYYEDRMSERGAAEFMDAHFIRADPLRRNARRV